MQFLDKQLQIPRFKRKRCEIQLKIECFLEKYCLISLMWNLKRNDTKGTYLPNRKRFTDLENELMVVQVGERAEGIIREFGSTCTH